jgi:hypothetical protein
MIDVDATARSSAEETIAIGPQHFEITSVSSAKGGCDHLPVSSTGLP